MSKIIKRDKNIARDHARKLTFSRFGQAPKVKVGRAEYADVLEATFLMGEHTMITSILALIKDTKGEDLDILIGELEIDQTKVWNEMASTKLGQKAFNKMYVEDISNETAINKHFKSGLR
jgi:hypothetical protein